MATQGPARPCPSGDGTDASVRPRVRTEPPDSAAVAAVAIRVVAQRAQEIDPPELRPERLGEIELRVHRLPHQETREPLLARGPDDEIGIGLAGGVEVLGDVVDVEDLRELLD